MILIGTGGTEILRRGGSPRKGPTLKRETMAQSENTHSCFSARMLPLSESPLACPTPHPVPIKTSASREEKQQDDGDYSWTLERSRLTSEGWLDSIALERNLARDGQTPGEDYLPTLFPFQLPFLERHYHQQ